MDRKIEIEPLAETQGEGNGWHRVSPDEATAWRVYDDDYPVNDEAFYSLREAEEYAAELRQLLR